jgi:hypothetical protein
VLGDDELEESDELLDESEEPPDVDVELSLLLDELAVAPDFAASRLSLR